MDGLRGQGDSIDVANPAKIEQYSGINHVDDKDDAFHLADLQRLNILPKAHVYDPELRPVRDLLRDRKSTRLNSSHVRISYAVFCLKKKKTALAGIRRPRDVC